MALLARLLWPVMVATVLLSSVCSAQEMEVPVSLQLPLFLKVASFDRQLGTRAGDTLVLAIAYQSGFRLSANVRQEAAVAVGARPTVAGLPIKVISIDLDKDDLGQALRRGHATLLYLTPVRALDVEDVMRVTRSARVTTMTGVVRYVELGLAVGVRLRGDRPRIVVNLAASKLEGAEFGAELLKLSEIR